MTTPFLIKYKPTTFSNINIDIDIKNLLYSLFEINSIVIMLVGENGSGKTTLINCILNEYYKDTSNATKNEHVLYINSIKEQGIQTQKNELSNFCLTKSTIKNKKKIIVIDDLDNINEQSQQVFRYNLDKYKEKVHFIFACVNHQKVLNGIISRVLCIKLNKPTIQEHFNIANTIIKNENIKIDHKTLKKVIELSDNSLQNMINLLEKIYLLNQENSVELVEYIGTIIENKIWRNFTEVCVHNKNIQKAIQIIMDIYNQGYSVSDILDTYFNYIKQEEHLTEVIKYEIIKLICKYTTIINTIYDSEIELYFFVNDIVKVSNIYEQTSNT